MCLWGVLEVVLPVGANNLPGGLEVGGNYHLLFGTTCSSQF